MRFRAKVASARPRWARCSRSSKGPPVLSSKRSTKTLQNSPQYLLLYKLSPYYLSWFETKSCKYLWMKQNRKFNSSNICVFLFYKFVAERPGDDGTCFTPRASRTMLSSTCFVNSSNELYFENVINNYIINPWSKIRVKRRAPPFRPSCSYNSTQRRYIEEEKNARVFFSWRIKILVKIRPMLSRIRSFRYFFQIYYSFCQKWQALYSNVINYSNSFLHKLCFHHCQYPNP